MRWASMRYPRASARQASGRGLGDPEQLIGFYRSNLMLVMPRGKKEYMTCISPQQLLSTKLMDVLFVDDQGGDCGKWILHLSKILLDVLFNRPCLPFSSSLSI
jgi:hypothetical protein